MIYDIDKVVVELIDILKRRGFQLRIVRGDILQAQKELEPVGIKKRVIHFFITSRRGSIDKDYVKGVDKLWNRTRPIKWRTFYFYNIVIVTNGDIDREAMKFIRDKMFGMWNVRPMFIWDVLNTSYTKITHLIDLKREAVVYPFELEDMKPFMHREVHEIMNEFVSKVFPANSGE